MFFFALSVLLMKQCGITRNLLHLNLLNICKSTEFFIQSTQIWSSESIKMFYFFFRMLVENKPDWSGRWSHLQKLLMRSGPLAHQDFEPGPQVKIFRNKFLSIFPRTKFIIYGLSQGSFCKIKNIGLICTYSQICNYCL